MLFSLKEGTTKVARIKGGKHHGKYIYLSEKGINEIKISDGVLQVLPNNDIVEKIYVSAPSGAGKSTFVGNWMKEYKKSHKEDPIYLFSSIDEDKPLDKSDPIRISLDDDLLEQPLEPIELQNSLVIFDDTDTIRQKEIRNYLASLRDHLLEVGRHYKIRLLITSHLLSNYAHTRRILNEATSVVVFPRSGNGTYHIKNFLKIYCGFDSKEIRKFINLPSRWVLINRGYPQYVIYEKGCYCPTLDNI
jgi:hypothetical protein